MFSSCLYYLLLFTFTQNLAMLTLNHHLRGRVNQGDTAFYIGNHYWLRKRCGKAYTLPSIFTQRKCPSWQELHMKARLAKQIFYDLVGYVKDQWR